MCLGERQIIPTRSVSFEVAHFHYHEVVKQQSPGSTLVLSFKQRNFKVRKRVTMSQAPHYLSGYD